MEPSHLTFVGTGMKRSGASLPRGGVLHLVLPTSSHLCGGATFASGGVLVRVPATMQIGRVAMIRILCALAFLAVAQPTYADTIGVTTAGGYTVLTFFDTVIGWSF